MKKTDQFTHKVVIQNKPKTTFLTLCIRYEGKGWYLYANDHLWGGPFDYPDQGADFAHWCIRPLPAVLGIAETPAALDDVSDDISDWMKV